MRHLMQQLADALRGLANERLPTGEGVSLPDNLLAARAALASYDAMHALRDDDAVAANEEDGLRLPWTVGPADDDTVEIVDDDECSPVMAQAMGADFDTGNTDIAHAVARRTAACVNACAGISTAALEAMAAQAVG